MNRKLINQYLSTVTQWHGEVSFQCDGAPDATRDDSP